MANWTGITGNGVGGGDSQVIILVHSWWPLSLSFYLYEKAVALKCWWKETLENDAELKPVLIKWKAE